jgi:hypothetical protein
MHAPVDRKRRRGVVRYEDTAFEEKTEGVCGEWSESRAERQITPGERSKKTAKNR